MFFTAIGDKFFPEFDKNYQMMLVGRNPCDDSNMESGDVVAERCVTLAEQQQLDDWKIKSQNLEHQVLKLQVLRPINQEWALLEVIFKTSKTMQRECICSHKLANITKLFIMQRCSVFENRFTVCCRAN